MTLTAMNPRLRVLLNTIDAEFGAKPAAYAAAPYLDALRSVGNGATSYYEDDVRHLVMYLVGNLGAWRGGSAKAVKAELKALVYGYTPRDVHKAVDKLGEARTGEILQGQAVSDASFEALAELIGAAA